ncbi:hypothetical protein BKA62DRAFT_688490 [Auriculariales sp. MPI-PUGE-AT-0066]|nr:hypothetical protein BKA62DRAFT_688490 [Auriculariales sp. MPI-PUGE-AT-0066]
MATVSPRLQHQLHARRGSASAPDPFALNSPRDGAGRNVASRNVTSKLTIVRVPSTGVEDQDSQMHHRRRSSGGSVSSIGSASRISFAGGLHAFGTGFTAIHAPTPTRPGASGTISGLHSRKSSSASIPSTPSRPFTPAEIVDLAHEATHPTTPGCDAAQPFTELDDDILLPFLDRPAEITTLIAGPPTSKLVAIISQMLPVDTTSETDPAKWSSSQLNTWLAKVTREEVSDVEWIEKLRLCVTTHSELMWERFKDALGVPSELDADDSEPALLGSVEKDAEGNFVDIEPVFLDSVPTSPIAGAIPEDAVEAAADGIQGLRILNSPTLPLGSLPEGSDHRPQSIKVHPQGSLRPHFPKTFSQEVVNPGPHGYAHLVAQRILNNNSPARR